MQRRAPSGAAAGEAAKAGPQPESRDRLTEQALDTLTELAHRTYHGPDNPYASTVRYKLLPDGKKRLWRLVARAVARELLPHA